MYIQSDDTVYVTRLHAHLLSFTFFTQSMLKRCKNYLGGQISTALFHPSGIWTLSELQLVPENGEKCVHIITNFEVPGILLYIVTELQVQCMCSCEPLTPVKT